LSLLARISSGFGANLRLTITAAEALVLYRWPQNIRELKMLVQRAAEDIAQDDSGRRTLDHPYLETLPTFAVRGVSAPVEKKRLPLRRTRVDSETLERVLAENDGNVSAAARALGRHRSQLHRWRKQYRLT
jgi:transcriptional regulator of acetoin/glycerol metabolism